MGGNDWGQQQQQQQQQPGSVPSLGLNAAVGGGSIDVTGYDGTGWLQDFERPTNSMPQQQPQQQQQQQQQQQGGCGAWATGQMPQSSTRAGVFPGNEQQHIRPGSGAAFRAALSLVTGTDPAGAAAAAAAGQQAPGSVRMGPGAPTGYAGASASSLADVGQYGSYAAASGMGGNDWGQQQQQQQQPGSVPSLGLNAAVGGRGKENRDPSQLLKGVYWGKGRKNPWRVQITYAGKVCRSHLPRQYQSSETCILTVGFLWPMNPINSKVVNHSNRPLTTFAINLVNSKPYATSLRH
jgi:hypothetical protein